MLLHDGCTQVLLVVVDNNNNDDDDDVLTACVGLKIGEIGGETGSIGDNGDIGDAGSSEEGDDKGKVSDELSHSINRPLLACSSASNGVIRI